MWLGAFTRHIFDAIIINSCRLPRYAFLSKGLSIPCSLGLIFFEIVILPLAIFYDISTKKWRDRGIPVMDEDFIDMKWTPEFNTKTSQIPESSFKWFPVAKWRKEINSLLKTNDYQKANERMEVFRGLLENHDAYAFPLLCHFLESVHRAINLSYIWSERFEQNETLKDQFLHHRRWFILWQAVGFEGALVLDRLAFGLYKKGLPIFRQDVPTIPVPRIE